MGFFSRKRLGDMLVELGKIDQEKLDEMLKKQKNSGKKLGELLLEEEVITENDLLDTLERQLGVKRIKVSEVEFDEKAVKAIPEALARKYNLIPFRIENNYLEVIMWDPLNIFAIDDVKISSGFEVKPFIATQNDIATAIGKFYSASYVQKAADELNKEHEANKEENAETSQAEDDLKNAPVVKLVDSIINNAARQGASDIHIEPFENYFKVRYRIDGELQEVLRNPMDGFAALSTRVKLLANLNIAEKRAPQDGRILTIVDGKPIDLRVSVLPTIYGEKIVTRLLRRDGTLIGKDNLKMYPDDLAKLNSIIANPHGIILVTGPTGSGKSTTLYTVLSDLNRPNVNIITVEDPVEYMLDGINQVNVNIKAGLTFAAGLRSILRQDPDIVMIGEMRDNETAEIAVRAAITGHLVLSTIHTNDAPSTIMRLEDMGIEKFLVSSSVVGIIAQRLVRTICPKCKTEYTATREEKVILGVDPDSELILHKGTGCTHCGNTGYKGRTGLYEILEVGRNLREAIVKDMTSDELADIAEKEGMKTIKMYGAQKVLDGVTTAEELLRVAYGKE